MILPSAWRSAEHETAIATGHDAPWRGSRITRTSWQKYLPPNCAPMPVLRAAPAPPLRARGRGSRAPSSLPVVAACRDTRRRELRRLQRVLGRRAADDDSQVIRRARRGAERAASSRRGTAAARRVEQRLRLLVQEALVGRAAALGHEQELVLVARRPRVELDLRRQVGAGVLLVPHVSGAICE